MHTTPTMLPPLPRGQVEPLEVGDLASWSIQVTVAGQRRTFTGFAVTTRTIRGDGYQ